MRGLIFLSLFVAAVTAVPSNPERISYGSLTTIDNFPSATALLFSDNLVTYQQACGGSILNSRSILSAANCFAGTEANRWRARVGSSFASSGGTVYNAQLLIIHANYDIQLRDNDIAILRTDSSIHFVSNAVQPSLIAGTNYYLVEYMSVTAIGWGYVSSSQPTSEQLRYKTMHMIDQETCASHYTELGFRVTDNMMCVRWLLTSDAQCEGDNGGPLYHRNVQVGVYSWSPGCGSGYPNINTRLPRYTNWIQLNA